MMNMLDAKARRKLSVDARGLGGITIPHARLQVHQNGAKFPVSKVYIDDEHLDPDLLYTLVIIPEGLRLDGDGCVLVLVAFDAKLGPVVLESVPGGRLSAAARDACIDWFDSGKSTGFFAASMGSHHGFNHIFEIDSHTSRTNKETFMLSLMTGRRQGAAVEDVVEALFDAHVPRLADVLHARNQSPPGGSAGDLTACIEATWAALERSTEMQGTVERE